MALVAAGVAAAVAVAATAAHVLTDYVRLHAVGILGGIAIPGWAYSVGPALAWRGLGEVDNAILGGLALPAYGYAVVSGAVGPTVLAACLPFAALVFANLLARPGWTARPTPQSARTRWRRAGFGSGSG